MRALLESLIPWGESVLKFIQQWHAPWLDTALTIFTRLGNAEGYLIVLSLLYWCIDAQMGRRASLGVLSMLWLNAVLKLSFLIPRPRAGGAIRTVIHARGDFAFPSGHAQGTFSMGAYLMRRWRQPAVWAGIILFILLIGYSRMYLGVHYPQDILGGWLFAAVSLALIWRFESDFAAWFTKQPLWLRLSLCFPVPMVGLLFFSSSDYVTPAAALFGICVGITLERHFIRFSTQGTIDQRILRYTAVIPVGLIMLGLKKILPEGSFWRFLRYAATGTTGFFVMPWMFVKLGWAQTEEALAETNDPS